LSNHTLVNNFQLIKKDFLFNLMKQLDFLPWITYDLNNILNELKIDFYNFENSQLIKKHNFSNPYQFNI